MDAYVEEHHVSLLRCAETAMPFKFACYFPADKPLFMAVNIESDAWVVEPLWAVRLKLQSHRREVDLDDLRLFKVKLFFLWQTAN
jgi:hypothetical protein